MKSGICNTNGCLIDAITILVRGPGKEIRLKEIAVVVISVIFLPASFSVELALTVPAGIYCFIVSGARMLDTGW